MSQTQMAYFGALGFTKPVEELVLWTVPLQGTKGPNLVEPCAPAEGLGLAVPYRALSIAATREMLYGDGGPLVRVGLVYKPSYIPTIGFSIAYMHLNEWHSTSSDKESEGHLEGPHLLFIAITEESGLFLVVTGHPLLLDTMAK